MKKCFKCGKEKELNKFYKHSEMADGYLGKCIECAKKDVLEHRNKNIERIRAYDRQRGKLPHRIKANAKRNKIRRKQYPLKYAAKIMVGNAVRDGRLKKLKYCERCGTKEKRLMGHHEDYYKPLEVIWLCQPCHVQRHKEIKGMGD